MALLTLADAKAHLNVTTDADDDLITAKLAAASDWVATYVGEFNGNEPPRVREAVLMLAAHLYNNRETVLVGITAQELPFGLLDMLSDYRAWCA
ncbi:putative phage protein (predicted DNA packaging) [Bradyrhizobium sp. AZCC 1610]|uniref:head-tail connector protein n=1 Tax=Bradyrhizobium sp. AZCC 1610 TaxID=3117020 RepID=UPI002FF3742F